MRVYRGLNEFSKIENAIVTTGTFDGVHFGHQTIIKKIISLAKKEKGETVLITFHPHPRFVLQKDCDLKLLSTIDERINLLEKFGIDHLIIIPFDIEFSKLTSEQFIKNILVEIINTKKLVIGYDHHFGKNREGSFEHLLKYGPVYGFEVEEIDAQDIDNTRVSSTKIRKAISSGDMMESKKLLGHQYLIAGKVIDGNKFGRSIGFPTANVQINNRHKLIPKIGVYAVNVEIEGKALKGMLNIGYRPTVFKDDSISIEVHLFNFDENIYNKEIKIYFVQGIRNEKVFNGVSELKKQLELDKIECLEILK